MKQKNFAALFVTTVLIGSNRYQLLSTNQHEPRARAFSVNGYAVWNSPPVDFNSPDISGDLFRKKLKTTDSTSS